MEHVKWVFFDVGSTLVDESNVYEKRMRLVAKTAKVPYEQVYQAALAFYRDNKKGDLEILNLFHVKKPPWSFEDETLYSETKECLRKLSEKYRIGVIANQERGTEKRLREFGILPYIHLVVASAEVGVAKPDKRIFEIALSRAACQPQQAVMVGDRIDNDIVPAKALGMKTIWVKQGFGKYWKKTTEREQADFEVNSLAGVLEILLDSKSRKDCAILPVNH